MDRTESRHSLTEAQRKFPRPTKKVSIPKTPSSQSTSKNFKIPKSSKKAPKLSHSSHILQNLALKYPLQMVKNCNFLATALQLRRNDGKLSFIIWGRFFRIRIRISWKCCRLRIKLWSCRGRRCRFIGRSSWLSGRRRIQWMIGFCRKLEGRSKCRT